MQRKPILVGQGPGQTGGYRDPLSGRPADRLSKLCGLSRGELLRSFERRNVLGRWYGKAGKGDAFPIRTAKRNALTMAREFRGRHVIFLGRNVASAFGAKNEQLFSWFVCGAKDRAFFAAIVPHPSGVNRFWNDKDNEFRAMRFLKRVVLIHTRRP